MRRAQVRVVVLGAGLAGLTAAHMLHRHRVPFTLFEAGRQIAGMGRSFRDAEGFCYDFGAHFITNRLAAALGIGGQCRDVVRYGETVHLYGRLYSYPFGLVTRPRFALSGTLARVRSPMRREQARSAAAWFEAEYGAAMAREVAIPLIEAWAGCPATELSAAVGDKIPSSILRTMMLRAAGRITQRAVAIGYCHALPESLHVWHVYPEGGLEVLCHRLAEGLDGAIRMETPVERIYVEDDRVVGVRAGGQVIEASTVLSTAPVHALSAMVEGTDRLAPLARFRYRPMVFVNLRLLGRGLLPDPVLWVPDRELCFFRLTETPLSMPWLAPSGRTLITCDIGCSLGDAIWSMPDEMLGELCVEHLAHIVPDAPRRYLGCRVLRTPLSYPLFHNSYEEERRRLQRGTGVKGLHSIGRNGEFAHLLMEDVYFRTVEKVRGLLQAGEIGA